ncbi:MAG: IPT/TIG domain-containing protein [Bacteroidales bacterium]|nr:IPT/TIG domain-containing protein [Bacteroidales bacterium]
MKLYNKNIAMLMAGLLTLSSGALVTSCDEDDDYSTSQFGGGQVKLVASSLQVTRGAYMTFKGNNLNQVSSIEFTGGVSSAPEVVDENTIRCLVPEGAAAGPVTLIYNGGEITTAAISFTEPITFDGYVAADTVKAGDKITIKGTYLNYIEFVRFATGDDVEVINAPTPPQITEFNVTVPVDASTGKIAIGYYSVVNGDTAEVLLENLKPLTVAEPSNLKLASKSVKAGDNVVITGTLLRLVESVTFAGNVTVASGIENPTVDVENLTIELPAEAQDGEVTLNLLSGLTVSAGELKTVMPTASIKEAKASYGIGDVVVIEGTDLDLIIAGAFTNGTDTLIYENGEIKLPVSAAAKSGDITLKLANGATVPVSGFVTTKPEFEFPTEATPVDMLDITVTNGIAGRVKTILFGDVEATATPAADGKSFKVQVPIAAENNKAVIMVMDNGETVTLVEPFTVKSFTFCAFKRGDEFEANTFVMGTMANGAVVNAEALEHVYVNDKEVGFFINGLDGGEPFVYFSAGPTMGKKKVKLVTGDTEVVYTMTVVSAGVVETELWSGELNVSGWGGARPDPNFVVADIPDEATLRIYIGENPASDLQLLDQNWGQGTGWSAQGNQIDFSKAELEAVAGTGYVETPISALKAWTDLGQLGIMFNADGVLVTKIVYAIDYSPATPIWTGSYSFIENSWGSVQLAADLLADVTVGQTFYVTVEGAESGAQISIKSMAAGWPGLESANEDDQWDVTNLPEGNSEFSFSLSAEDLASVKEFGMVVSGQKYIVTKIAIK